MAKVHFISHPEITVDPETPVEKWRLSDKGIARMRAYARSAPPFDAIWSSSEAKAIEAAGILAAGMGLPIEIDARLGENDRSATGFLPPPEFEKTADAFFANPEQSIRGWERAIDAQRRIVDAVYEIASRFADDASIAIVAHGGVGTLLLCKLMDVPISRAYDQPHQGHVFSFDARTNAFSHGWRSIDASSI